MVIWQSAYYTTSERARGCPSVMFSAWLSALRISAKVSGVCIQRVLWAAGVQCFSTVEPNAESDR